MTTTAGVPTDIRFTTPGDWVALHLPHTEAEVTAVVDRLVARDPELESRRPLVEAVLRGLSEASRVANCLYAGGAFLPLPGGPLPVTLLVNALPLVAIGDPPDLARAAAAIDSDGHRHHSSAEVDLPCGPAARIEWLQAAQLASSGTEVMSFFTQYVVTPRDTAMVLVLTFSSPAVAIADRLQKLFRDIAASLEIVP
jgi:hypothetical protein